MKKVEDLIREAQNSMYGNELDTSDIPFRFKKVQKVQK